MSSGKIPASMRERSSRLVLSHSSRPICSVDRSRNSARVASSTWPSIWSSVYTLSAAIGVRSSWLTSATNSRSRSRSASSMRSVPASRSAMTLNCAASSSTSSTPDAVARSSSSPWARRLATPRSRLIGTVRLRAAMMPMISETTSARIPAPTRASRMRASVSARVEYGSLIDDPVRGLVAGRKVDGGFCRNRRDVRVATEALALEALGIGRLGLRHDAALLVQDGDRGVCRPARP